MVMKRYVESRGLPPGTSVSRNTHIILEVCLGKRMSLAPLPPWVVPKKVPLCKNRSIFVAKRSLLYVREVRLASETNSIIKNG